MNDMSLNENIVGYVESPFKWHSGMTYEEIEDGHVISLTAYLKMYNKGVFGTEELMTIFNLFRLGYSTRNTLAYLITSKDRLKSSLNKLVKHGIVVRCTLNYQKEQHTVHSVYFYKLSSVGNQIAKVQKESGGISLTKTLLSTMKTAADTIIAPIEILKNLALNTFIASIADDGYEQYVMRLITDYHITLGNKIFIQKAIYELKCDEGLSRTLLIPLVARRNSNWKKELIYVLSIIDSNLKNAFKNYELVYIVIVEDNIMACDAAKSINGVAALRGSAVMYVSDWTVNNGKILDNLLNVNAPRCDSYSIIRLAL